MLRLTIASHVTLPPPVPPVVAVRREYGSYCWRATCDVTDDAGDPVARFIGYAPHIGICAETHDTCVRVAGKGCGQPQLVLLTASTKECSGIFMFDYKDQSTKKLV
jgi:hypothetical protein